MLRALLAEDEYQALSGQWLASWERKKAISLTEPDYRKEQSDWEFEREYGMQNIVQGSLRLAAHQVLGEEPHFGGKHSERLMSISEDLPVLDAPVTMLNPLLLNRMELFCPSWPYTTISRMRKLTVLLPAET
jgi:hypothetical protein